jgi:hypothetical protein
MRTVLPSPYLPLSNINSLRTFKCLNGNPSRHDYTRFLCPGLFGITSLFLFRQVLTMEFLTALSNELLSNILDFLKGEIRYREYPTGQSTTVLDSLPRLCMRTGHLTGILSLAQSCPRAPSMPGRSQRLLGVMWFTPFPVKVDLRPIHILRLQSLALGHYTFFHDPEFDWVVSHQSTLKKLCLDICFILHQIDFAISGYLDEEDTYVVIYCMEERMQCTLIGPRIQGLKGLQQ